MKILIVDDNADDRRLLRYNCEMHGYKDLVLARDGQEALEMARLHKPDFIISDALMPNMDGFQFLRELKKDDTLRSIPFVFYSATYIGSKEAELASSLGAEAFIVKPIEPEVFWQKVKLIIEKCNQIKAKITSPELAGEDKEYLSRYSHIVATKLEEKMKELEDTNTRLVESEAFVKNILESVDEGLIVIDREYKIISANRAYCIQFNLSAEDILGRYCYEVSHHINTPCFEKGEKCSAWNTFETGQHCEFLHVHQIGKGEPIYVETKSYPLKDQHGNIVSVIEIINNVTEKRKIEDQLRQSQKMEAVGQLAGGIAHDFNNLLNVIIGYGDLIKRKLAEDDPVRPYLAEVLSAGERAAHLTQGLLTFSRKQIMNPRAVNLNDIVKSIEKLLRRVVGEDIEFNVSLATGGLTVMADPSQIEQVLMNLSANSRDAMPRGGRLTIATQEICIEKDDFIKTHGIDEVGRYALMSITDTGTGMSEATREKIFEPFFTTKEEGKGTGLGLSIVYGIIKQHGGYINVYSEQNIGTTFKIYLPLVRTVAEDMVLTKGTDKIKGGTETLLLAEDSEQVRGYVRSALQEAGYSVIEAIDGIEAVEKFRQGRDRISLVILDMVMPGLSGTEVYEEINKISPDIRAIFMSGYALDFLSRKGMSIKDIDFIPKPCKPGDLLMKVREILDRRATAKNS